MSSSYFTGRVLNVIFKNSTTSFYVIRMDLDQVRGFTVVRGCVPSMTLQEGSWLGFEGKWTSHKKYGKQIEIERAPVVRGDMTPEMATGILASNGVSTRVCRMLIDRFGRDEFVSALRDQDRLREVLSPLEAELVFGKWRYIRVYFQTLQMLADLGFPRTRIQDIWNHFGVNTEEVLSENPWSLVALGGMEFHRLDEVALRLGISLDNEKRTEAAVYLASVTARGMGHVFVRASDLFQEAGKLAPGVGPKKIAKALASNHKRGILVVDRQWEKAVYDPWMHTVETEAAEGILYRVGRDLSDIVEESARTLEKGDEALARATVGVPAVETLKTAVALWSNRANLKLSTEQSEGILNALIEPVSILTGLPGTGKTTSMRILVRLFQDMGMRLLLLAPTGIAAKRLQQVTGASASTVHRAFEARGFSEDRRKADYAGVQGEAEHNLRIGKTGEHEVWGFSPSHPHTANVAIVDEASMVDQAMLYRILTCTSPKCRVVFVGDAAQLPSVGPGNVLRDLISSGRIPTVSMTRIFRQDEASDIVHAAHAIHSGEVPAARRGSDFCLIPISDEQGIVDMIQKLSEKLKGRAADFQVLSPRHAGAVGVTNLNEVLREALNPPRSNRTEARVGNWVVRQDDRVMVVRNNYDLDVFNGDVGRILSVDLKQRTVVVEIQGTRVRHVSFSFAEVGDLLRLAYAVTIHKAQGQEYDYIILPIIRAFGRQLQRNLLYTAVTRAIKRVFLVGEHQALARAVHNNKEDSRNTLLINRLAE
jgi:exodeoxyribonuclease V alpha subunit